VCHAGTEVRDLEKFWQWPNGHAIRNSNNLCRFFFLTEVFREPYEPVLHLPVRKTLMALEATTNERAFAMLRYSAITLASAVDTRTVSLRQQPTFSSVGDLDERTGRWQ
jgi:hypothetical protein